MGQCSGGGFCCLQSPAPCKSLGTSQPDPMLGPIQLCAQQRSGRGGKSLVFPLLGASIYLNRPCTGRREEERRRGPLLWPLTGWRLGGGERLLLNCLLGVLDLEVGLTEMPWTFGPVGAGFLSCLTPSLNSCAASNKLPSLSEPGVLDMQNGVICAWKGFWADW